MIDDKIQLLADWSDIWDEIRKHLGDKNIKNINAILGQTKSALPNKYFFCLSQRRTVAEMNQYYT